MNLRRFVWRNALRNKRRTTLTMLSIGFSLFLLMILLTFMGMLLNPVIEDDSALRLLTIRTTSLADMMPISYLDKIKRVPNVTHAAPLQWFNGTYRDPNYQFANFATDPKAIWEIYSEQKIAPEQATAFIADRTAAVAGEDLMRRYGWKIGDRFTLNGNIFPVDLDLKIVGSFTAPIAQNMLYFHYDYFNEAMGGLNQAGSYVIKVADAASVPVVSEAIDAMFRNTPAETKTQTEKAFVLGFVSMLGNIQLIILSVAGVVVFTMLLVSVSTMAMSVRERLREVAILRTLGFSRWTVMALVIAEAIFVALAGTVLGIALGESLRLLDLDRMTQGFIPKFDPGLSAYLYVLAAGIAIGLLSGLLPGWQATNIPITSAMRQLE